MFLCKFLNIVYSLSNIMTENVQLTCEKAALTAVIEMLQSLKEDVKTGNVKLSCLQIR